MNLKALQRAFMKEANRLIKNANKNNVHKPFDIQLEESVKRVHDNMEKFDDEKKPVQKDDSD